jgi:hypothetical protein
MPAHSDAVEEHGLHAEKSETGTDSRAGTGLLLAFGASLFLSALLLFSVQPIFAKMVLPTLGGTPAVWSIAMVFFQGVLLAGYLYAHGLVRLIPLRTAIIVHLAVMLAGLYWLPFGIWPGFERAPEAGLPLWLLGLFAMSIGFPFFAVSANAPLLQAWFARTGHIHSSDPYFLYGASNLGSFFALLSYPVLIEPLLAISGQSWVWSWGYGLLIAALLGCGVLAVQRSRGRSGEDHAAALGATARPSGKQRLTWLTLAFIPSGLLVAVTAHLSTNIAAAPFLWVIPLALFLLTFVITFQRNPVIPHRVMLACLPFAVMAALVLPMTPLDVGILADIILHLAAFFVAAMVCHGELVSRRPDAAHLTEFYLLMSLGGVLGGAFTSLLSPVIFSTVLEYPILLAAALLVPRETREILSRNRRVTIGALACIPIVSVSVWLGSSQLDTRKRSFFGVITIDHTSDGVYRRFSHGTTIHGAEKVSDVGLVKDSDPRPESLSYYVKDGPMAEAIGLRRTLAGGQLNVGIVGLGVGSLACFAEQGDNWRFYEIDPAVVSFARDPKWFNYLSRCTPDAPVVVGDARLTVQDEPAGTFDILVIDAFSSDAVPVHLLTREAIDGYFDKLKPDGVLVMHLSNKYMDLSRVVSSLANADGWAVRHKVHLRTREEKRKYWFPSEVMTLARKETDLLGWNEAGWRAPPDPQNVVPWTDDYSNIVSAILRKQGVL